MKLVLIFIIIVVMIGVFHYNNLYAQEALPEDFISQPQPTMDITSRDFNNDDNFSPNAMVIVQDILHYNQTEIKDYPLTDLPPEDIKSVFMILDSGNITKVLLNIPVNDIHEIQNMLSEEEFNNILNRVSIENQTQIKERINIPILIPYNSFFVPKNALPLYLPNNSLLIEKSTGIPIQIPDNAIFVPNEGPVSIINNSALVVDSNHGPPLNLPNGSLIGINGEILVPLPKEPLILNDTDAPLPLPDNVSLWIGNNTELQNLVLNGSRIVNSNEKWFLILPNNLGTIIIPNKVIQNLPQGTIIIPNKVIQNLPQGSVIVAKTINYSG